MMKEKLLSKKVGIIGGGQLGKMMVNEASKMGIYTMVLDPCEDCPAGYLANDKIIASFDDKTALKELAKQVDVLTCEFEHISTEALKELESDGFVVYPKASSLEIIQNKYHQKMVLQKHNIPLGDFVLVNDIKSIEAAIDEFGYPVMLKSALGGYDGKGNSLIRSQEDIEKAFEELKGDTNPLYAEKYIPFIKEISVLCCRGIDGETVVYPVAENIHKDSILFESSVPAAIDQECEEKAMTIAKNVCEIFETVGMFCVEMFLTEQGEVLVNEVAPRPHNSGHYTIEGCITSQFENHMRAILGLSLGKTDLLRPTVMRNILGAEGYEGKPLVLGAYEVLSIEGVSLHIYGKKETKAQRKMGHLTVVAQTLDEAKERAEKASACVRIISE
ncbi:MAG: phosphoribosylaminoimidazole carboxylase, ATPase subunit [Anaerosolibacter sp.]|jgi:5-(carboxyamino)imidazole ribonucleotide synthase|uniref:5-(carboxyamino)imidazole ribonucleotide synthase n=1 Tax=Anaerosolibacter sp. TaxID=1872527 RepID=UPI00262ED6DD|nr:5-(carboxyamino)imidazole ribonucleotide synthase [Anaerosolibacter sp.]MDF2545174.1 phosphoribosylaminoimidazole carboxylase, ATPase subunit [Anaerosolibacter sp.]